MINFMKRIGGSVSLGHLFVTFDGKTVFVPSMVASTVMCLVTVTFAPWAVPMVVDFYGTNGRGTIVAGTKEKATA